MENKILFDYISNKAVELGAYRACVTEASEIELDRSFRLACESNACGVYGKCYMCPPDVGDIDELMWEVGKYKYAFVYQTVSELEDSFDFEGMIEAKKKSYPLAQSVREIFYELNVGNALHLGAGGCGVCETCAKRTGDPCRFPERATPSLEAYGINVSSLAKSAGMKYINGQNTVTYFGAVLFNLEENNIITYVNGKLKLANIGDYLSEIANSEKPCGGHARCGKCKVIATGELSSVTDEELKLLSDDELKFGVRLACLTKALGECEIKSVSDDDGAKILEWVAISFSRGSSPFKQLTFYGEQITTEDKPRELLNRVISLQLNGRPDLQRIL